MEPAYHVSMIGNSTKSPHRPKLIGLSGKKYSGKSTFAEMVISRLPNHKSHIIGFADALKREAAEMLKISVAELEANKADYRTFLQVLGTDIRRYMHGENYWVNQLHAEVLRNCDYDFIFIPDVRFRNELEYVKDNDGVMVRVIRDAYQHSADSHISENALDESQFDHYVTACDKAELLDQANQFAHILTC